MNSSKKNKKISDHYNATELLNKLVEDNPELVEMILQESIDVLKHSKLTKKETISLFTHSLKFTSSLSI